MCVLIPGRLTLNSFSHLEYFPQLPPNKQAPFPPPEFCTEFCTGYLTGPHNNPGEKPCYSDVDREAQRG